MLLFRLVILLLCLNSQLLFPISCSTHQRWNILLFVLGRHKHFLVGKRENLNKKRPTYFGSFGCVVTNKKGIERFRIASDWEIQYSDEKRSGRLNLRRGFSFSCLVSRLWPAFPQTLRKNQLVPSIKDSRGLELIYARTFSVLNYLDVILIPPITHHTLDISSLLSYSFCNSARNSRSPPGLLDIRTKKFLV